MLKIPQLDVRGACKSFGATRALHNVSIKAFTGQVLAVVGENGAGKSTLMKILSGALRPDSGVMYIDGDIYSPSDPVDARAAGVTMIYQELSLVPHMSVEENVMLGMEPSLMGVINQGQLTGCAMRAIRQFGHPEITAKARVSSLSPACRQLIEIARALAVGCRVLILDEPSSSLAERDIEKLFEIISMLKRQGKSIIYISHFMEEVQRIADRVAVLRDGRVVDTQPVGELTSKEIVSMMVGRHLDQLYPRSVRTRGDVVLKVDGLKGAKRPVSAGFELRRGEVLGIAGLVGSGRTEMLRCLFGLDSVKSGYIKLGSYEGPASPEQRWSQGAGLLSEDRKSEALALRMSVSDNITLSSLKEFGPFGLVFPARQRESAKKWIKKLDIKCSGYSQETVLLSGGNQQKTALARLLQHDVDVLFLDEPTRGVDVAAKSVIYQLIDDLAAGSQAENRPPKAILIVSSYLPELLGICDRVAVMCRGVLGPARDVKGLTRHSIMMEATGQERD